MHVSARYSGGLEAKFGLAWRQIHAISCATRQELNTRRNLAPIRLKAKRQVFIGLGDVGLETRFRNATGGERNKATQHDRTNNDSRSKEGQAGLCEGLG